MKAVVVSGGKQYIVAEKDQILVDLINDAKENAKIEMDVLALIDGKNTKVGTPTAGKASAKIVEPLVKGDKVVAIRYEAKKRVNKKIGSRKQMTRIEITKIA
jgi:large subunit ribosomal protein L21